MKKVINAVVRIEYDVYDNNNVYNEDDIKQNALDLAINPNFHSFVGGVSLDSVHIEVVEPYTLIDWDKLEHNPETSHTRN